MNAPVPQPGDLVVVHHNVWYDPCDTFPDGRYVERAAPAIVVGVEEQDETGGPWVTHRSLRRSGEFGTDAPLRAWECGYGIQLTGWAWPEPGEMRERAARLCRIADQLDGTDADVTIPAEVVAEFLATIEHLPDFLGGYDRCSIEHPAGSDVYWSIFGGADTDRTVDVFHHPVHGRHTELGAFIVGSDWQRTKGRWRDRRRFDQLTGGQQ